MTIEEAEIATAPETEFEPGRFTPPPASIARLAAVTTKFPETLPDVFKRTTLNLLDGKFIAAETEMPPEVDDPIRTVCAVRKLISFWVIESLPLVSVPRSIDKFGVAGRIVMMP